EEMVQSMAEGSVIVDLAAPAGGNCPLTELDKVVVKHGVTLVGHGNLAGLLPVDASNLFAKNLFNFLSPMVDKENKTVVFDWDDEIIKGSLVTKDGEIVNSTVAAAGEG
ncbi:MAG: NAD(P)(+) transhydrogenase (Re/Si-specific) subunit alpha, partial [Magnetospiraceae bacterium]